MNIDLSRFIDENITSLPIEGNINIDEVDINGRVINFDKPIDYKGTIYRVGMDKFIDIDIEYNYSEFCGRCLNSFIKSSKTKLIGQLVIGNENEDVFEDLGEEIIFYNGEILDLTNDIKSMIILDLPMKPICKEECEGLCPVCGIDKNKHNCDCEIDTVDPRFSKLKEFFPED